MTANNHQIVSQTTKPTLSWSALSQYMRCPQQYFLARVVRVPTGPKASALFEGTCGHAGVEYYFRQRLENKEPSVAEVIDYFNDYWEAALRFETYDWSNGPPQERQKAVRVALRAHLEQVAPTLSPKVIEQPWRVALPECSFDLGGVVDLVDADLQIVDHKFYNRVPHPEDVDKDGQLAVYAIARAEGAFGACDNWADIPLGLAIAIKGTSIARLLWTTRTPAQLLWWRRNIVQIAKAIDAHVWPGNVNGWWHTPKFCQYWDYCQNGG